MIPAVTKRGFTFIEILIVVAVIAILSVISAYTFKSMYAKVTRDSGSREVYSALREARTKTLSAENDLVFGVHISSTTVTRFEGNTFSSGATGNKIYFFEGSIRATSTTMDAGGVSFVFTPLTGVPNATGTIYIFDVDGSGTTSVILHESGLIEL